MGTSVTTTNESSVTMAAATTTTTTSTDAQDFTSASLYDDNYSDTVLASTDTDDFGEEEPSVTEGEYDEKTERAVAVAAEMACEIVEDELPIPLVKEFYKWMYALLLGKHYTSKNDSIDNYEWDQTSPQDALNQVSYVLLSQYDSKCNLNFCALQLTLSYIVNLANEEMKDIVLPCMSDTSIVQWLDHKYNDEATSEQINDEYGCISKIGDKICQSLFDKKTKKSQETLSRCLEKH
ncbi:hypothetical protein BDC45DRAFT_184838 [Circinella umbellata]|nr:hypothetical protein BDC45DRAFT_184838 [Circinella umbellata]